MKELKDLEGIYEYSVPYVTAEIQTVSKRDGIIKLYNLYLEIRLIKMEDL